jgi:hypothetical protein
MDLRKMRISEHDYVELREAVGRWPAGTRGAVVDDYGRDKLIEIADDRGQELDMFVVSEEKLGLIKHHPPKVSRVAPTV